MKQASVLAVVTAIAALPAAFAGLHLHASEDLDRAQVAAAANKVEHATLIATHDAPTAAPAAAGAMDLATGSMNRPAIFFRPLRRRSVDR